MNEIGLADAQRIVAATLARKNAAAGKPLAVAVVDDAGNIKVVVREDGATMFRTDIAFGKAWGAVAMGAPSRTIAEVAQRSPNFVAALAAASGGKIIPVPGGVLIRDSNGKMLGAVGVSGDSSDRDEAFAIAGVAAAGLQPDPDTPAQGAASG
jgi:uncharacterized protein GlcG (DUF336 family)